MHMDYNCNSNTGTRGTIAQGTTASVQVGIPLPVPLYRIGISCRHRRYNLYKEKKDRGSDGSGTMI
jgi:hypothetical protein